MWTSILIWETTKDGTKSASASISAIESVRFAESLATARGGIEP